MSGFGPKIKKKLKAEINVVPMIDVMLVLLIVFMIAAPMMTQGIKVELPKAAADPVDTKDDEPITVSIKQDGSYYIEAGGDPDGRAERRTAQCALPGGIADARGRPCLGACRALDQARPQARLAPRMV